MIREGLNFFSTTWSMIHILVLFVLFFESRYPRNKTRKIIMAVVIPSFLFFILLAKYRDARFVF